MFTKIEIMQHNLKFIRKVLGFNAARLAEELGCSRQLIQQLESDHHKMSKIFYLAMLQAIQSYYDTLDCENQKLINLLLMHKAIEKLEILD